MDELRQRFLFSFLDLELALFQERTRAMAKGLEKFLAWLDDQILLHRDGRRYQVKQIEERTLETLFGWPVTFRRREYYDQVDIMGPGF